LQYLKYFFIAGLPKAIMQLVAAKDPASFTEAHKEATRLQELTKAKSDNGHSSTSRVEQRNNDSINQIKGNGTQNPYRGNYRGRGAPHVAPSGRGNYNGNGGQPRTGDNQSQNTTKPTCWYCNIYGHHQEDCQKCIRENQPCKPGLNRHNLQLVKEMNNKKPKVQLEKCTQEIWPLATVSLAFQ